MPYLRKLGVSRRQISVKFRIRNLGVVGGGGVYCESCWCLHIAVLLMLSGVASCNGK